MKIDSQKLLPGSSGSLSLIAVKGNKITALSDSKKTIKFDNFVDKVESVKVKRKRKTGGVKTQFKTLRLDLLSIESTLRKQIENDKKYKEKTRKRSEKVRRKEKETALEKPKIKGKGAGLAKKLAPTSIFDAIKNFIGNILLGKFVLFLLDNYDKFLAFLKFTAPVTNFLGALTTNIFGGIVSLVEGVFGVEDAIRKEIDAIGGDGATKEFDNFTSALKKYLNLAIILTMAGIPTSVPVGGQRPKGPLGKAVKPLPKGAPQGRSSAIRDYLSRNSRTKLIEKRYGNAAARIYQNALKNGKGSQAAQAAVQRAIQKGQIVPRAAGPGLGRGAGATRGGIFRRGVGRSVSRLQTRVLGRGTRLGLNRLAARGASRFLGRIPIIGPLIAGISTYMETGKLDKALFIAGGSALGGFLGSFIPIPVLGTLLGTFVGEYVGDLFYELFRGGGPQAVGDKLKRDIQKVIDGVNLVKDWIWKGVTNIGKMKGPKIPDRIGPVSIPFIPKGGLNLGGWADLLNPIENPFKKFNILRKAFFSESETAQEGQETVKETGEAQPHADDPKSGGGKTKIKTGTALGTSPSASITPVKLTAAQIKTNTGSKTAGAGLTKDKNSMIYLHWTGGFHNSGSSRYHRVFLGDGTMTGNQDYGAYTPGYHTANRNDNAVGLSIAAMGHKGMRPDYYDSAKGFAENPPTKQQLNAMAAEAARLAVAWGWDESTIKTNVMTHYETDVADYSAAEGGGTTRWDLKYLAHADRDKGNVGGPFMRGMILKHFRRFKRIEAGENPDVQPHADDKSKKTNVKKTKLDKFFETTRPGGGAEFPITGVGKVERSQGIMGFGVGDKLYLYDGAAEFESRGGVIEGREKIKQYLEKNYPQMLNQASAGGDKKIASAGDILPTSAASNLNSDILRTKTLYEEGSSTLVALQPILVEKQVQSDPFGSIMPTPQFT